MYNQCSRNLVSKMCNANIISTILYIHGHRPDAVPSILYFLLLDIYISNTLSVLLFNCFVFCSILRYVILYSTIFCFSMLVTVDSDCFVLLRVFAQCVKFLHF